MTFLAFSSPLSHSKSLPRLSIDNSCLKGREWGLDRLFLRVGLSQDSDRDEGIFNGLFEGYVGLLGIALLTDEEGWDVVDSV